MSDVIHLPDDRSLDLSSPTATLDGFLSKARHGRDEAESIFDDWQEAVTRIEDELCRRDEILAKRSGRLVASEASATQEREP